MKKKPSRSYKGFSDIRLNWDAVRSFVSDVKAVNKIPESSRIAAFENKSKTEASEIKEPQSNDTMGSPEMIIIDKKQHTETESSKSALVSPTESAQKNTKENLIDVVNELNSFAKVRRKVGIFPIARVHCLYDKKGKTFWFTNRLYHPRELSDLRSFGTFVPRYSDVAIKMQKSEVGTEFDYIGRNNINRLQTYHVLLENQADLQNQTIAIAGDSL